MKALLFFFLVILFSYYRFAALEISRKKYCDLFFFPSSGRLHAQLLPQRPTLHQPLLFLNFFTRPYLISFHIPFHSSFVCSFLSFHCLLSIPPRNRSLTLRESIPETSISPRAHWQSISVFPSPNHIWPLLQLLYWSSVSSILRFGKPSWVYCSLVRGSPFKRYPLTTFMFSLTIEPPFLLVYDFRCSFASSYAILCSPFFIRVLLLFKPHHQQWECSNSVRLMAGVLGRSKESLNLHSLCSIVKFSITWKQFPCPISLPYFTLLRP